MVEGDDADAGGQFHDLPELYLELIRAEVPAYDEFQAAVAAACGDLAVDRMLELGIGTGETAQRVGQVHPEAALVGIDESEDMVAIAGAARPGADLRVGRLEDPLPEGGFDLVYGAFVVHHLDGPGKADLFGRIASRLRPGGRFVIGDVVVPDDPADAVTPLDPLRDQPDSAADQVAWLGDAGFTAEVSWRRRDLVVIAADLPR